MLCSPCAPPGGWRAGRCTLRHAHSALSKSGIALPVRSDCATCTHPSNAMRSTEVRRGDGAVSVSVYCAEVVRERNAQPRPAPARRICTHVQFPFRRITTSAQSRLGKHIYAGGRAASRRGIRCGLRILQQLGLHTRRGCCADLDHQSRVRSSRHQNDPEICPRDVVELRRSRHAID